MSEGIILKKEGAIATLTLNRPQVMNAFSLPMADQLKQALNQVAEDDGGRVVILRGAGQAFSAGGDIKQMSKVKDLPQFFDQISQKIHEAVLIIRRMPQTVIAVCNGPVSGVSFGLAVACDLRIASPEATFHAGTTALGLAPNGSLSYFLPRLIGRGRATQMILTAEKISAMEAHAIGLVNEVAAPEDLDKMVHRWVEKLKGKSPLVHKKTKELFLELDHDLVEHLDRERHAISETAGSADFREGIQAFLEKRSPQFHGK